MPTYFISFLAIHKELHAIFHLRSPHGFVLWNCYLLGFIGDIYTSKPGVASPANSSNLQNNLQSPIKYWPYFQKASCLMLLVNYGFRQCYLYSNLKPGIALLWVNSALFSTSAHFKCLLIAVLCGYVDKGKSKGSMQNISSKVLELNAYDLKN